MTAMAQFHWDPATYRALMRSEVPAYDELQDRALREVVEQLCGDLGLTPDWSDWTDEG